MVAEVEKVAARAHKIQCKAQNGVLLCLCIVEILRKPSIPYFYFI